MWSYESRAGKMRIMYNGGSYSLEIDNTVYGFYSSPELAADDVASFVTGCYEWDSLALNVTDFPSDLSEWDQP